MQIFTQKLQVAPSPVPVQLLPLRSENVSTFARDDQVLPA